MAHWERVQVAPDFAGLTSVGVVRAATGKYRKAALYQADDILDLLEHGAGVTRA
jgi:hypothetical protein